MARKKKTENVPEKEFPNLVKHRPSGKTYMPLLWMETIGLYIAIPVEDEHVVSNVVSLQVAQCDLEGAPLKLEPDLGEQDAG